VTLELVFPAAGSVLPTDHAYPLYAALARLVPAFHDPATPFFSTVTTRVETHGADLAEILVQQLTAPVRFTQAVQELVGLGVTQFVEIGSGSVLSGLVRRIDRSVQAIAVSNPDGLQKLEAARV